MKLLRFIFPLAAGVILSSCSSSTSPSGFLENYSQLGGGHDPANSMAVYVNEGAEFGRYDSIIIDPVATVVDAESIDALTVEQLAAYVDEALSEALEKDYKIVNAPGPSTMRVRACLTDIIAGQPATLPVVRTYVGPRVRLSGELGSEEVAAFIGNVSFEAEILDSTTGKRLSATTDQRYGIKRSATPDTDWSQIRAFVGEGATRFRDRMGVNR